MSTVIKHFTHEIHVPYILFHQEIWLEGENLKRTVQDIESMKQYPPEIQNDIRLRHRLIQKDGKRMGLYVWFTEEDSCKCILNPGETSRVPLMFNSDDIDVVKWTDVIRQRHWDRKFNKTWNNLKRVTEDDYTKWWVSRKPVSIENMINKNDLIKEYNYTKEVS